MSAPYRIPARIETERLVIRRYREDDAEALYEVASRNREHLLRYMVWAQYEPQTPAQRRLFIATVNADFDAGTDYTMGMFARPDGAYLGGTGFHVRTAPERLEIGYWLDAAREGEGLATEAAAALTRVGLEFAGATLVSIAHAPTNARSGAVPARLGFVRQDAPAEYTCHDSGQPVSPVDWQADAAVLASDPLSSFPHPSLFDADGTPLAWPDRS